MIEISLGYLLIIIGFIIGLGPVTVIDIHGFLGRKSDYWTEATTRTHKVTKPMIWIGTLSLLAGVLISYSGDLLMAQLIIVSILILNGLFLSFSVSPFLLKRESENQQAELLPKSWQIKITLSFIVSVMGWWTSVLLFVIQIS